MNALDKALEKYNNTEGHYYFTKDTMRFFGSRISSWYYQKDDSIYFGISNLPPYDKRIYSVICIRDNELYQIDKDGKEDSGADVFKRSFYSMSSARRLAKKVAGK